MRPVGTVKDAYVATKGKPLDSNALKLIAIVAMTIDHVTWMLFPGYSMHPIAIVLHTIGRLTCPIMCYFIAEGFHYTHDVKKYTTRLFLFALISHVPYVLNSMTFVDWKSFIPGYYGSFLNQTSVMWSLAWGLVMLRINASQKLGSWAKVGLVLVCCLLAFPSDWSCIASLCVLSIGANRGNPKAQTIWSLFYVAIYAAVYFFALDKVYGLIQFGVVLAIPLLALYNGKRGSNPKANKAFKWLFYIYYPIHLLVIGLIEYLG